MDPDAASNRWASTERGSGTSTIEQTPVPISGAVRRVCARFSNQRSSESGSRCWARTLTFFAP